MNKKTSSKQTKSKTRTKTTSTDSTKVVDSFGEIFTQFGDAVGQIFDDPKLKSEAQKFTKHAVASAKRFGTRFKDKEVKEKFNEVGKAASKFGKNVKEYVNKK